MIRKTTKIFKDIFTIFTIVDNNNNNNNNNNNDNNIIIIIIIIIIISSPRLGITGLMSSGE